MTTFISEDVLKEFESKEDYLFECFKLVHEIIKISPELILNLNKLELNNPTDSSSILYDTYTFFINSIFIKKNINKEENKGLVIDHQILTKLQKFWIRIKVRQELNRKYNPIAIEFYNILEEFGYKYSKNSGIDVELLDKKLIDIGIKLYDYIELCHFRRGCMGKKINQAVKNV